MGGSRVCEFDNDILTMKLRGLFQKDWQCAFFSAIKPRTLVYKVPNKQATFHGSEEKIRSRKDLFLRELWPLKEG